MVAPGSMTPAGQVTVALSSVTLSGPVRVTFPLFVTTYVYVMTSPTAAYVWGSALLTSVRAAVCVACAVAVSVAGVSVPPAGVPSAVALLVTVPASRSAWVTVWTAVQVVVSVGARVVASQTGAGSTLSSLTARSVIVTLPVLVTR